MNKKDNIKEKFMKQLEYEVNISSMKKEDIQKSIEELKKRFKNEDFNKFKNSTEAWNYYWKTLNRIIKKFEDKKILPQDKIKEIKDKIIKINELEGYRAFFFSKDGKSLKYQPRLSYSGDDASSIIRLENMKEIEKMIENNSVIYRHKKEDKITQKGITFKQEVYDYVDKYSKKKLISKKEENLGYIKGHIPKSKDELHQIYIYAIDNYDKIKKEQTDRSNKEKKKQKEKDEYWSRDQKIGERLQEDPNLLKRLKKKLEDNKKFIKSSKTSKTISEHKKIFELWKIVLEIDVLGNKRKNNKITLSDYRKEKKSLKYYYSRMEDAKGLNYLSLSDLYYESYNKIKSYDKLFLEPKEKERKKIIDEFVEKNDVDQYGMCYGEIEDYIKKLVNKYKTNILSDRKRPYEYDYKLFESELTMNKIKKINEIKDKEIILYVLTSLMDEITLYLNEDLPYLNYKNDISVRLDMPKSKVPHHPLRSSYKRGLSDFFHKDLKQNFFGYTGVKLTKNEISTIYHKVYIYVYE